MIVMWCGPMPTRMCVCVDTDACARFPWHPSDPVGDDWRDDDDDDN